MDEARIDEIQRTILSMGRGRPSMLFFKHEGENLDEISRVLNAFLEGPLALIGTDDLRRFNENAARGNGELRPMNGIYDYSIEFTDGRQDNNTGALGTVGEIESLRLTLLTEDAFHAVEAQRRRMVEGASALLDDLQHISAEDFLAAVDDFFEASNMPCEPTMFDKLFLPKSRLSLLTADWKEEGADKLSATFMHGNKGAPANPIALERIFRIIFEDELGLSESIYSTRLLQEKIPGAKTKSDAGVKVGGYGEAFRSALSDFAKNFLAQRAEGTPEDLSQALFGNNRADLLLDHTIVRKEATDIFEKILGNAGLASKEVTEIIETAKNNENYHCAVLLKDAHAIHLSRKGQGESPRINRGDDDNSPAL